MDVTLTGILFLVLESWILGEVKTCEKNTEKTRKK